MKWNKCKQKLINKNKQGTHTRLSKYFKNSNLIEAQLKP